MQLASDPSIDCKALVKCGYDACAAAYHRARREDPQPELSWLIERLEGGSRVLDIGCGAGVPVARELAVRFDVTGVDLSEAMVHLARRNVPHARFVHADIMSLCYPPTSFDAAVAFYSIFHLPREEHCELFRRIHRWLVPGGYLLATLSAVREPPYTEEFHDVPMYWSNHGLPEYERMLVSLGFQVEERGALGHGYSEECAGGDEHHPLILARKA